MLTLIPLLIDEPHIPRTARDALVAARYAACDETVEAAKRRAAEILAHAYALSPEELQELLDLHAPKLGGEGSGA